MTNTGAKNADHTILRRRNRRTPYTTISNTPLQDKRLSLEAVGLLVCVLSLPENWLFNRKHARERFNIGREKLDRILRELKDMGYILHVQERDEAGRMSKSVYVFSDDPGQFDESEVAVESHRDTAFPLADKPLHGEPSSGKPAPIKRKEKEKLITEKGADAPDFEISLKRWEERVRSYLNRRLWPANKWGPAPGVPGCKVPRHILEKHQLHRGIQ